MPQSTRQPALLEGSFLAIDRPDTAGTRSFDVVRRISRGGDAELEAGQPLEEVLSKVAFS